MDRGSAAGTPPALAVIDGVKRFGGVVALDHVSIAVRAGEVVALLGDNGAGKSTLIKCLAGVHRLDAGSIEVDGVEVRIDSPAAAQALGIETVYQDLALFDNLDPAANFYAGRELAGPSWLPRWLRILRPGQMRTATDAVLSDLRVTLPSVGTVGLMSGGQRQAVAVARAAAFASRIVVLDEPTAALGARESRSVLDLIVRLREGGKAVVVISHALDHVIEVADRAIVMRRGRVVGEEVPTRENQARLVSLIVGGEA